MNSRYENRDVGNKIHIFILLCSILSSCVMREKPKARDPRDQAPVQDLAEYQKQQQYERDARSTEVFGIRLISRRCNVTRNYIGDWQLGQVESDCEESFTLRLKFECKTVIGTAAPLVLPLRHRDVVVDLIPSPQKPTSFPRKLTTNGEGVVVASLQSHEGLGSYKVLISRDDKKQEVSADLAALPITLSKELCEPTK